MKIVVDTNIVVSALLNTNSNIANLLMDSAGQFQFYAPNFLLSEITKNKSKFLRYTKLKDSDFDDLLNHVVANIYFLDESLIPPNTHKNAEDAVVKIDSADAVFVALAKHLSAKLWTGVKVLMRGLQRKGFKKCFTTEQLLKR